MDPSTLTVLDRRFIVKSVVQLRITRTFVHNFSKDPDLAISTLFEKARSRDDPVGLGQLMFRTLDLDRAKLGDYLSRRTSKLVLKVYIDCFGFTGLRINHALRPRSQHPTPQDLLFDPPALMFAESLEASFRITRTSFGQKRITMCRSGSNALLDSGLPLIISVAVEHAFMRNMFQMAFSDMHCVHGQLSLTFRFAVFYICIFTYNK